MKKQKPEKNSDSPAESRVRRLSRNGSQRTAIENVFRLTHGREMTEEEKRLFGLSNDSEERRTNRRPSHEREDEGADSGI